MRPLVSPRTQLRQLPLLRLGVWGESYSPTTTEHKKRANGVEEGCFHTQRRAKPTTITGFGVDRWVGWIWRGFGLELDVRILKSFKCFWSFAGWVDLAGICTGTQCTGPSALNDAQNTKVLHIFLVVRSVGGFGGDFHDVQVLPHPTTCKTLEAFKCVWSFAGWYPSSPNDAQKNQVVHILLVVRWLGGFGGDFHWNSMFGSFRTQRCVKPSKPSSVYGCSLGGSMTTQMGRSKKKSTQERPDSTAAERKKVSWATYYKQKGEMNIHSGDIIQEKRRMQMAEKRALLKAKRRASDKLRPKKGRLVRGKGTVSPDNDQQPEDSGLSDGGVGGPSVDIPHDNEARILADAEREASETLAGMWQAGLLQRVESQTRHLIESGTGSS
ncbi:hypothetical protein B0H10DRAFT_1962751 [Mycena sp. CBHHK59/15]|nr:hypothetical protein B0H10DRAFT_1962751 [Mycena sp. CBHHK59/15]